MMKRRFPCLNLLRVKLDTVLAVIVDVGVLWNISVMRHEPEVGGPEPDEEVPGDDAPHGVEGDARAIVTGQLRRRQLINTLQLIIHILKVCLSSLSDDASEYASH